jgi:NAD(P)-dependent dehydrogenase (short-subunit alcohol dehydrogenase family)
MDVTSEESVRQAIGEVLAAEGCIDAAVNNAGYGLAGPIEHTTIEQAQRQMDVNFFGIVRICQAVLPAMRAQRAGVIVNISSLGGLIGLPFQAMYSASKFAIEGFTEALRYETLPFGIRTVLVEPGDIRTAITANRERADGAGNAYDELFDTVLSIIEREERRGVDPDSVARLVTAICDGRSCRLRYTSGKISQRGTAWIKRVLPHVSFERMLGLYYGLSGRTVQPQRTEPAPGRSGATG